MIMKKRIAVFAVVVVVAASAFFLFHSKRGQESVCDRIEVSGTMEVVETECSFRIGGEIVELGVFEGDVLKKGDLIGRLDDSDVVQDIAVARSEAGMIRARLPKIALEAAQTRKARAGELDAAGEKVREARSLYEKALSGARPEEIRKAVHLVDETSYVLENRRVDYERAENLYCKDAISRQKRDEARMLFLTAEEENKQAVAALDLLRAGTRREDVEAALMAYRQSLSALEVAKAKMLDVDKLDEDGRILMAELESANERLKRLELTKSHCSLFAPLGGTVLRKTAEKGENVAAGAVVVTIGGLDDIYLKGYVQETDLAKVKLGQKALLRTDTYRERTYSGRVSYISDQAEFTPKNLTTKDDRVRLVYRIKVTADNSSGDLKPGMIADAEILIGGDGGGI